MIPKKTCVEGGFTLIELSIVLVIIGLIVGGILVGRDLINAAAVRSQISQIEKFATAANTFKGKYAYLPGDIPDPDASRFGFAARGLYAGEGDGNDTLEGIYANSAGRNSGYIFGGGENLMFWVDLNKAGLISENMTTAVPNVLVAPISASQVPLYFPLAKIGQGNYVYVYSNTYPGVYPVVNLFGISVVLNVEAAGCASCMASNPGLTVAQAYAIDSKIDDGTPILGKVVARAPDYQTGSSVSNAPYAVTGTASTCFDTNTLPGHYSIGYGNNLNCWLSFKF